MGKRLFVGNLPFNADENGIRALFEQCGTVEKVNIITDRATGKSKGFSFVDMSNDEEAERAISQLNGSQFGGRALTVNEAKPQAPRGDFRGPRRE